MTKKEAADLKEARRASLIEKWASGKRLTPDESDEIKDVVREGAKNEKLTNKELCDLSGESKSRVSEYFRRDPPPPRDGPGFMRWLSETINKHKVHLEIDGSPGTNEDFAWPARLKRARDNELAISRFCEAAIRDNKVGVIDKLLTAQAHSIELVAQAEKIATQIQLDLGEVVRREEIEAAIKEIGRRLVEFLEFLPISERQRCNPENPEVAQAVLTEWKERALQTFRDMAKDYYGSP
jgi:hypothetical protein